MAVPRSDESEVDDLVEDSTLDDELREPDEDVFDEEDFAEAPEDEVFGPGVPDVAEVEDVDADAADGDINLAVVEAIPEEDGEEEDVLVRVVGEEDEELEDVDGLREGEFICVSCFLVKGPTQLADATRMICVDCV
ncbi:MAG: hypothetical protein M3133_04135 [Actinomycetota bacterium]|nr:hypothetical protein [Actinomycetota bacterium]